MLEAVLQGLAALGLAAALPVGWGGGRGLRAGSAALGVAAAFLALSPPLVPLVPSQFKGLSQALEVDGARVTATRASPLGVLSAVENDRIPVRHAPGLSLASTSVVASQVRVYTDAEHLRVITRFDGDFARLRYLAETTSALPYHGVRPARMLVLGAGGGAEVLQALEAGAEEVHAVELDPEMVALVREDFAGDLYRHPKVRVHVAEARDHLRATPGRYDLVQVALLDSFGAAALLGPERERFFERYKFHVAPASDDRPYFSRFVKWAHLPELLRLQRQGGIGLLELGYPVFVATLGVSLLAGALERVSFPRSG